MSVKPLPVNLLTNRNLLGLCRLLWGKPDGIEASVDVLLHIPMDSGVLQDALLDVTGCVVPPIPSVWTAVATVSEPWRAQIRHQTDEEFGCLLSLLCVLQGLGLLPETPPSQHD